MDQKRQYHILQNIIFPVAEQADKTALFVKGNHGAAHISDNLHEFALKEDDIVDFATYFNSFSHKKWFELTGISSLGLRISGEGCVTVRILAYNKTASAFPVHEETIVFDKSEHCILLPKVESIPGTMIGIELKTTDKTARIKNPAWITWDVPKRTVRLAAVVTTFKREKAVLNAIWKFRNIIIPRSVNADIELFVIDNGCSVSLPDNNLHIHLVPNPNLGGAGGFARGLLEVQKRGGFSHMLFMDDDAACEPESVWRSCALLSYAQNERLSIAGSMFYTEEPMVQYEKGASLIMHGRGGIWKSYCSDRNLSDIVAVAGNDLSEQANYGGWWFFAFPVGAVSKYPFPFFVRGDDTDFSVSNNLEIATLNGVAAWCENFGYKIAPSVEYLAWRSWFALTLLHSDRRKIKKCYRLCWKLALRHALRYQYGCAHAVLDALEDVAKGPDFFKQNPAPVEKLKNLGNEYPADKVDVSLVSQLVSVPRKRKLIRKLLGRLTLYGLLLPERFICKCYIHVRSPWSTKKWDLLKYDGAVYGVGENVALFKRDRRALKNVIFRIFAIRMKFLNRLNGLQKDYQNKADSLRTRHYWEETFNRFTNRTEHLTQHENNKTKTLSDENPEYEYTAVTETGDFDAGLS